MYYILCLWWYISKTYSDIEENYFSKYFNIDICLSMNKAILREFKIFLISVVVKNGCYLLPNSDSTIQKKKIKNSISKLLIIK